MEQALWCEYVCPNCSGPAFRGDPVAHFTCDAVLCQDCGFLFDSSSPAAIRTFPACFARASATGWIPHARRDGQPARKRQLASGRWVYQIVRNDSEEDSDAGAGQRRDAAEQRDSERVRSYVQTYVRTNENVSELTDFITHLSQNYSASEIRSMASQTGLRVPESENSPRQAAAWLLRGIIRSSQERQAEQIERQLEEARASRTDAGGSESLASWRKSLQGVSLQAAPVYPPDVEVAWSQQATNNAQKLTGEKPDGLYASAALAPPGTQLIMGTALDEKLPMMVSGKGFESKCILHEENGKRLLHVSMLRIDQDSPYHGMGGELFANQLRAAREMGVDQVRLFAAGNLGAANLPVGADWNGYATWPKFGFDGAMEEESFMALPAPVRARLGVSRSVQDLLALPAGSELWERHGSGIKMHFDLNDERAQAILAARLTRTRGQPRAKPPSASLARGTPARIAARQAELDAVINKHWSANFSMWRLS